MNAIKVLVPISGGKDSQAALKLALQHHKPEDVRGLFCDTQFEHPLTYEHVEKLRTMYGDIVIDTVCGGSVIEKTLKHQRFPGGGARHCTDELKIRMTKLYCKWLALLQGRGFEVWYGMRTGESNERAKRYAGKVCDELYTPHQVMPSKYPKYLADELGVMFRLAILDWSESDVLEFLNSEENPLYADGFPRVGCFPCQASGDKWKKKAYKYDDFGRQQYAAIKIVSQQIGKPMFNSKSGQMPDAELEGPGCMICQI